MFTPDEFLSYHAGWEMRPNFSGENVKNTSGQWRIYQALFLSRQKMTGTLLGKLAMPTRVNLVPKLQPWAKNGGRQWSPPAAAGIKARCWAGNHWAPEPQEEPQEEPQGSGLQSLREGQGISNCCCWPLWAQKVIPSVIRIRWEMDRPPRKRRHYRRYTT